MGLDPEQRQQRQVTNEAAEEAAAHSNWTYPWPPAGDGDGASPDIGGDRDAVAPSNRVGQPHRPPGRPSLWKRVVAAAAIAGGAALLWKWRLRVRRRRELAQYGGS